MSRMMSKYKDNMKNFMTDSQNFTLHLSEESTVEETLNLVSTDEMEDKNDVIVISDSSSNSSSGYINLARAKSTSDINRKKTMYPKSYCLRISSENEEEQFNRVYDNKSSDGYRNKSILKFNAISYTSDETTVSSSDTNCDRNMKNPSMNNVANSCTTPTLMIAKENMTGKYSTKQMDKMTAPSNTMHYSKISSRLNQFQIYHTPLQNRGRLKLTKEDAQKIFRNIRKGKITYDSPRDRKGSNMIIDESTDADEDAIHPAVTPASIKKLTYPDESCDVINTSLQDNIIPDSRENSSKPSQVYVTHVPDTPEEPLHRPLSEKKKRQIAEWLIMNSPDSSRSDSSCSNVPPSTRNSRDSGNSSLERLERNYETPNNRGRINKVQTAQSDRKQTPIVNTVIQSVSTTRQTTLDKFIQKSRNNNSEFKTPDRTVVVPSKASEEISSAMKNPELGINDCTDILDKLYGKEWRDKATILLPSTEPRKTFVQTTNRAVQTERKMILKKQYNNTTDSDSEDPDSNKNKIKAIRKKTSRQTKEQSFINDESLSDNDVESLYYTALTNPRTSTNSTVSKPSTTSIPSSVKRLQTICDTDTEDSDESSDSKKLSRRKLVFDDDKQSSDTSEFDPGDYVPAKHVHGKEIAKTSQPSKTASRFMLTSNPVIYKSFLASLSYSVPMNNVHRDAKKYRSDYKNNKETLCKELYKLYNEKVFDDKLPRDIPIEWNIRMRGTAGYCYNKKSIKSLSGVVKSSRIVLATKIVDTPDRLRDTLIHEMCHAAAWLLNDVSDGHGPFWTGWANKAMKTFPELPPIRRCHDYEIKTKFTYRCTGCGYSIGRHSKSLDVEKKRCGHCYGKFELLINKTTKSGTVQIQTPKKEPSGFALYVKENYNSVKKEKGNVKHADVMKILGQQFSAIKIARKNDADMPDSI